MTIEEILKALSHKDNNFPREALEQAVARKDEITPHLLKILEKVADDPDEALNSEDHSYHYALICWRGTVPRDGGLSVDLPHSFSPARAVDALLGETITEGLPKILAFGVRRQHEPDYAAGGEHRRGKVRARFGALRHGCAHNSAATKPATK